MSGPCERAEALLRGKSPILGLLVGDEQVGKSSLLSAWQNEMFSATVPKVHKMVMAPPAKLCTATNRFVLMDTEGVPESQVANFPALHCM